MPTIHLNLGTRLEAGAPVMYSMAQWVMVGRLLWKKFSTPVMIGKAFDAKLQFSRKQVSNEILHFTLDNERPVVSRVLVGEAARPGPCPVPQSLPKRTDWLINSCNDSRIRILFLLTSTDWCCSNRGPQQSVWSYRHHGCQLLSLREQT